MTGRTGAPFDPEDLRAQVVGRVVAPGDAGYDEARRVWNGMIDRRPAAVVRAANVDDVRATLAAARASGLPLAIRGGSHNVAGNGTVDGGLVLDLGGLADVSVDGEERVVRVGPGATLADLDRATEPFGLVVPIGVVSATGVAGLTLGGGVGWLTRAYGLTVDNLLEVEIVTANGELVRASENEHRDLFWAIRGGGGNFGVVTSFTFRAQALGPDVFAGTFVYGRPRWVDALRAYANWTNGQPDLLTSIITFLRPPRDWELGDETVLLIGFTWAGSLHADGERVVSGLRDLAPPDVELLEPTRWVPWQSAADELFPQGVRAYWKNASFDRLDEETIDVILRHAATLDWHRTGIDVHHMEGAVARVPPGATPFPNRTARYWLNIYGVWEDGALDTERIRWVRSFHRAMAPHAARGQYVNFLGAEPPDADERAAALAAYGRAILERLISVKRRYDPDNLFRLNHNIDPAWDVAAP